jgi:PAS domain-containing protein
MLAVGFTAYFMLDKQYIYTVPFIILIIISLYNLNHSYAQYNRNITFLLNALENGDYSFHFSENKMTVREREMHQMMNRIRDILSKAKIEVIENEHFLSIILEKVDTGIIIMDDRGVIQSINRSALDMLGVPILSHIRQLRTVNK